MLSTQNFDKNYFFYHLAILAVLDAEALAWP